MTATTTDPRAKLPNTPLSGNEALKERSDYLHGTIKEELKDDFTGGFTADNFQLIRFHGMYEQDNRDIRAERTEQKLEPLKKHDVALPFARRHHYAEAVAGYRQICR